MTNPNEDRLPDREGEPEDTIDKAAMVSQFLRELDMADLVVELVQNELDAGATRTVIDFGDRALTCEGNGRPIDRKGWSRLETLLGAGGDVEAKPDGIGSKNHGLRSGFLLGDRIGIQSDGLRVDLTVRGDRARPNQFKPGFWPRTSDPDAPAQGVRITVPYRTERLARPDGDGAFLDPITRSELDRIWRDALSDAPERFVSASTPGSPWSYTLILSRSGQEDHELHFASKPLGGPLRGLWDRTCKVRTPGRPLTTRLRRHAVRFGLEVSDGGKVPRLFRSSGKVFGEVNWLVSRAGRPQASRGGLRYPIAFPQTDARSGHGFDISAPFIAGRARHSISSDDRNQDLVDTARAAMAVAGPLLAKAYGPDVGVLVRSLDPQSADRDPERQLVLGWLTSGGLSILRFGKGLHPVVTGWAPMSPGADLTLARPEGQTTAIETLCRLASGLGGVVSPDHGDDLLGLLSDLADGDHPQVTIFTEEDAARRTFIETLPQLHRVSPEALAIASAALASLDSRRRSHGLSGSLVEDLQTDGVLPIQSRTFSAWSDIRRHDQPPPEIPGVEPPPVLHLDLNTATVLRAGALELKKFNLNDFVSTLDFTGASTNACRTFFGWFRTNAGTLKAATLKRVVQYPVWPGSDGQFRLLEAYCRPKARRLQEMLAGTLHLPSLAVIQLVSDRKLPVKALQLRGEPTEAEFQAWHDHVIAEIRTTGSTPSGRKQLADLEADMDWLRERDPAALEAFEDHVTWPQAGDLERVEKLHLPNSVTLACALSPTTLTQTRRVRLYEALGAKSKPDAASIVAALRNDLDWSRLIIRLEAYRASGNNLDELAGELIIPGSDGPRAPDTLAFAGEPDYWGTWKTRLKAGDVAHHHSLLNQVGVIRATPTRDTSLAFFGWLAGQSRETRREHQTQIARHWRELAFGPVAWAQNHAATPCLPVTGKGRSFDLVGLGEVAARNALIFLDDFPEVRDAVIKQDKARLTINKAPGFQFSNLEDFSLAGVPSLKREFGPPRSIIIEGELKIAADLDAELARLKSGTLLASLKAKLPLHNVSLSSLRPEWQKLIKGLSGVRTSRALVAKHRFLGADYEVPIDGGIAQGSSIVCLAASADRQNEFYAVLCRHIFKAGLGDANTWGFMRAARDQRQLSLLEGEDADPVEDKDIGVDGSETGDVHSGHGVSDAKLTPIVPEPTALDDITDPTQLSGRKKRFRARARSRTDDRRNTLEEEEQKRQLKEDHYAYHCQACLGEMDVLKAAPPGTYVFSPGYRARLLHAHHAHQMQNEGMIGGKNLLILCEFHHRVWGDHLSRAKVSAGLATASKTRRHFPTDLEGVDVRAKAGLLAIVDLDVAPFRAKLFFTQLHADAWLGDQHAVASAAGKPDNSEHQT